MNQQLAIDFSPRTLARTHDPDTSIAAAERVQEFAGKHHKSILQCLREHGPCTAHEIAEYTGIDAHRLLKRCGELQRVKAIAVVIDGAGDELTRLTPSGRRARVWFCL